MVLELQRSPEPALLKTKIPNLIELICHLPWAPHCENQITLNDSPKRTCEIQLESQSINKCAHSQVMGIGEHKTQVSIALPSRSFNAGETSYDTIRFLRRLSSSYVPQRTATASQMQADLQGVYALSFIFLSVWFLPKQKLRAGQGR